MAQEVDPVKTARLFEFYVRRIWPWQRRLVAGRLARRCSRCGASERMLTLDASGVCSECVRQAAQGVPPRRAPDAALQADLAAVLAGGALFIVGYTQNVCTRPGCEALFKPDLPGALLLGVGGAALIVGASWFGWSAANHPRFHRDSATAQAKMSARSPANLLTLKPIVSPTFAGVLSELRF